MNTHLVALSYFSDYLRSGTQIISFMCVCVCVCAHVYRTLKNVLTSTHKHTSSILTHSQTFQSPTGHTSPMHSIHAYHVDKYIQHNPHCTCTQGQLHYLYTCMYICTLSCTLKSEALCQSQSNPLLLYMYTSILLCGSHLEAP